MERQGSFTQQCLGMAARMSPSPNGGAAAGSNSCWVAVAVEVAGTATQTPLRPRCRAVPGTTMRRLLLADMGTETERSRRAMPALQVQSPLGSPPLFGLKWVAA
ncbi:DNA replication complex GINS protein PSF2 [Zea mays]|uniref:DNA replication complex GINS protein PSF2 n=1 Tax=Zea mays TaxID=4577 RepID=A0A1D6F508_MAIZE|nr:DNA replication complex GINS protein PSF2 [Zea mays]